MRSLLQVQHTNMLVDAKRKEQQTEEHLRQLVSTAEAAACTDPSLF